MQQGYHFLKSACFTKAPLMDAALSVRCSNQSAERSDATDLRAKIGIGLE